MSRAFINSADEIFKEFATQEYLAYLRRSTDLIGADVVVEAGLLKILETSDPSEPISQGLASIDTLLTHNMLSSLVDNFQCYLVDLLFAIFNSNPRIISSGQIKNSFVFDFDDIDSLKRAIIDRHVLDLGYKKIEELDSYFSDNMKFPLTVGKFQSYRLNRVIQIRNIISHNRGLVSSVFLNRVGCKADELNQPVNLPNVYAVRNFLDRIVLRIDDDAIEKFSLNTVQKNQNAR